MKLLNRMKEFFSRPEWMLVALYTVALLFAGVRMIQNRASIPAQRWKTPQECVAVVPINGMISFNSQGPFSESGGSERIVKRLKSLSEKDEVKAIVLRINSPGGSVGAVQEICDEVQRLKNSGKKVVASIGDVGASGGYYVACSADKIFVNPGTLTGSIGVIFQTGNVQDLFKKIGVKMDAIKSSEHKDIGSPFRAMSPKEREMLQGVIDDVYEQFVQAVVVGRKMERAKVLALADGRVFSGSQAKEEGLVDELGNSQAAIAYAASLAGIKGKPKILIEEGGWFRFFSSLSDDSHMSFKWAQSITSSQLAYLWDYSL